MKKTDPKKELEKKIRLEKEEAIKAKKDLEKKERQKKEELNLAKHRAHHDRSGSPRGRTGILGSGKGGKR